MAPKGSAAPSTAEASRYFTLDQGMMIICWSVWMVSLSDSENPFRALDERTGGILDLGGEHHFHLGAIVEVNGHLLLVIHGRYPFLFGYP